MVAEHPTEHRLAQWLATSRRVVALTGAGMSTESGISDYRSKGGLWERFQHVTLDEFLDSERSREAFWAYSREFWEQLSVAQPGAGHRALRELWRGGWLSGILTQNIDGLHQQAGIPAEQVLELHGSSRATVCLSCGDRRPAQEIYDRIVQGERVPRCHRCHGLIKPTIVMFGERLDPQVLDQATRWASSCDIFVAIGSTLLVQPAASLPLVAKQAGARLVILTRSETPLDEVADLKITGAIGGVLAEMVRVLGARRPAGSI